MQSSVELTALFRAQGLRVTPQRQAIFRLLADNDRHPTVDALHDAVSSEMPTISLKTVYQTVHDLEALGQVSLLDVGTGSVRVDPNVEVPHHHLVCTECGRVGDVAVAEVPALPARSRREFRVRSVEVIFRGECVRCADGETTSSPDEDHSTTTVHPATKEHHG